MTSVPAPGSDTSCQNCGAALPPGSAFCEKCGSRVSGAEGGAHAMETTAPSSWPAPSQPYPGQPGAPVGSFPAPSVEDRHLQDNLLVGSASPNETYLGNRLAYTDAGTNFDPLDNPSYQRALLSQFAATVSAWMIGSVVLFLVLGIAGIAQQIRLIQENALSAFGGGAVPSSPLLWIWLILWALLSIALAVLFWMRKLTVQLSEWMLTVDGQGRVAALALDHMYTIIAARRTPIGQMSVVRLNPSKQQTRDYLRVDDGVFTGFVSCFPYGADLFIGWSYWINMSPGRWLIMTAQRIFRGGDAIYTSLAYDQPKALREVLHSAVRQGVDIAAGNAEPQGRGTLDYQVPLTVTL